MTVRTAQQIFLLSRVGIIGWNIIHMCAVAPNLSADGTGTAAYELGDFPVAQSVHIIFSYTATLLYAKMMIVHTGLLSRLNLVWQLHSTRDPYELLYFSKVLHLIV